MSKLFVAVSFVFAALAGPAVADDKDKKIEGQYTVVSAEKDGKALPQDEITGKTVRITADKITVTDKEGKEVWAATYAVDDSKKPCRLTMKGTGSNDGKEFTGICERTDGQVKVCFCMDGGETPTEFKAKEKQALYVLKPTEK